MGIDSVSSLLDEMSDSRPNRGRPSTSADKVTERSQEKKTAGSKRGKTFTGCWTCRERHVKCDEQRPKCKRCIAGNFACQGYSRRLTWLTPMSQRVSKSNDRTRHTAEESSPMGFDVPTNGSFSEFRASQPGHTPKRRRQADHRSRPTVVTEQAGQDVRPAEPRDVETIRPIQIVRTADKPAMFERVSNDMIVSFGDNGMVHSKQQNRDPNLWPTVNSSSWRPGVDYLQPNWYAYSQQFPNSGSDISRFLDHMSIPHIGSPITPFGATSSAARERELISHWATNLADKFVPFRSPANPFLTVVSPMALEGSRIARTKSTCTVALFHAVCAISAAHQANLRAWPSDDGLVLHHKQLSFHHLMQNMDRGDHDERMACLATLCLWILIHFVTGTPGAWREVTKVTRGLLEGISAETWAQSTTAALTYQSFSSSFALIQAQYLGRQDSLAPLETAIPGVDMVKSQIMPARSLELMSSFNTKLIRAHVLSSDELDQLEIEFALSTPEPSTDFDAGNAASAMVHHHRSLFYYASLLYFRGNSGRRGPEEEVQSLVARCLEHMEYLDLQQKDGSPKTWVYAVVAFEAATPELRDRTRCLFAKRMSLGIATWGTLLLAVEEIWKRRDATFPGFEPEPWTRVLAKMPELDIILY